MPESRVRDSILPDVEAPPPAAGPPAPPQIPPVSAAEDDRLPPVENHAILARRRAAARLPEARKILAWIYAVRLAIAVGMFVSVAFVWQQAGPQVTLAASLVLVVTGSVTAAAFWFTHLLNRWPGKNFLYGQTIFDTLLVTWIVYLTGGQGSAFAPTYILVICAAAILLPFLGGILVALLASVLYVAVVVLLSTQETLNGGVALQLFLFTVVALVTGYLGDRLRQTGAVLGEVETQLRLLRMDTDDILGSINTGVLTVDGYGRLAYMNAAAAQILSVAPGEWLGMPVIDALDDAAPGLGWVIDRSRRERQPIARFETGDLLEHSFVLGVSTTLLDRSDGEPPVTAIFQDITQKKRLEVVERRAERLEAVAELSASLAHEIKNPLASVRSAVEQLADSGVDPEDRMFLKGLVVRESDRLSRLLAEFIDFARVKVTTPEPVRFTPLVHDVVALVRAHPDAAQCAIHFDAPADGPALEVHGDEDLLHRAVLNLVLNAVQWAGPGGEARVSVDRAHSDILSPVLGVSELIRLTVADSGPGIDPDVAEHIFNPFFTRRPGGTGLGLALVQRAAEAHGGVIFVDGSRTAELQGAVFTLCLPAAPAVEPTIRVPNMLEEKS
ncbi:MAG: PAS domain-containing protein [Gemmatimonadetes bacterium]|nr:PAS domain-containing protein [Gemmatimonadota bacterium]